MGLSALTFWEWIVVAVYFLIFAAISYWRIRECVQAYQVSNRLVFKIIVAVVLCIFTLLSTLFLFLLFRGRWCEGCQEYH